jgi:hypothetical protein
LKSDSVLAAKAVPYFKKRCRHKETRNTTARHERLQPIPGVVQTFHPICWVTTLKMLCDRQNMQDAASHRHRLSHRHVQGIHQAQASQCGADATADAQHSCRTTTHSAQHVSQACHSWQVPITHRRLTWHPNYEQHQLRCQMQTTSHTPPTHMSGG